MGWKLEKGGLDSAAGRFASDGLVVLYDYGVYSDPLRVPEGASQASATQLTIDGHSARQVRYTLQRTGMPPMNYLGIHLGGLGTTSMGSLKLTMRAESTDATRLAEAEAAFSTLRIRSSTKR